MAGVNPLRGEAVFKAGDFERTLVINVNTFVELEEATGFGVDELIARIQTSPSFTLLRQIFCAALQTKHAGTTLRETGDLMSDAGLVEITAALQTAIQRAMPPAKSDAEVKDGSANPPKPRAKAGAG